MNQRPKLLFLCQTLPYPPDGGVAIRSYNILRLLAERYDVTALCFYRTAAVRDLAGSLKALQGIANSVEVFPIEQEHSRLRLLWDHARSVAARRAYTVYAYESTRFGERLRELTATTTFDLAHVDSLDLSAYLPALGRIPTIVVHHNVESALLRRRASVESSALRRRYVALQAGLMEDEERRWLARVAMNVAVSDADRQDLLRMAPDARVTVVPNGVDVDVFHPADNGSEGIVFVGGMTWFPNRDALEYFARDILPLLRRSGASTEVTWVGRALNGAAEQYATQGIKLTGYVEDIRPFVHKAACYVVPLRVGGGTRLKILDAWAMGKAIVSTSIGCEGLDAVDGENILIRDDPGAFASAIRSVLADSELRARLGRNARNTATDTYSWAAIGRAMHAEYDALLAAPPGQRSTHAI